MATIEIHRMEAKDGSKRQTYSMRVTGKGNSAYQKISKSQFTKLLKVAEVKISNSEMVVAEVR